MSQEPRPFQEEMGGDAQQALGVVRTRYLEGGPSPAARERMRARLAQAVASEPAAGERGASARRWLTRGLPVVLVAGLVGWGVLRPGSHEIPAAPAVPLAPAAPDENAAEPALPPSAPEPVVEPAAPRPPARANGPRVKRERVVPVAEPAGPSELAMLQRARRALGADPAESLRIVDDHRTRYPRGTFVEEREVLRIEALVALGQGAQARAAAQRFEVAYPASAHLARIAHITGRGVE